MPTWQKQFELVFPVVINSRSFQSGLVLKMLTGLTLVFSVEHFGIMLGDIWDRNWNHMFVYLYEENRKWQSHDFPDHCRILVVSIFEMYPH